MDELDVLYFGNKISEVAKAVSAFTVAYNLTQRELYKKVLDDFKNGTAGKDINRDLYEAYGDNFRKAVDSVLGDSEYGDEYFDMRMQMRANVSRFAAYKAYHATQELKDIDTKDIDRRARLVLNKYNRWQATEYNTAVARTRTAKQYHDFTSDPISNELYPNLKWLPSRSASPREAHRVFWNRVWAKNDPFWKTNTPGSLWNCKCDWEETDEPVTNGNPNGKVSATGLEGNPAVTGEIFSDNSPYVKKGGGHSVVNGFYRDRLIEAYKGNEKKTIVFVKGVPKEVLINSIGVSETAQKKFGHPDYWLKNELLGNIDKCLPHATYIREEYVDLSHNKGKTLKLKKKMSKAHKFQYNVGNKPFIITLFEYKDNGNLLFYYIETP